MSGEIPPELDSQAQRDPTAEEHSKTLLDDAPAEVEKRPVLHKTRASQRAQKAMEEFELYERMRQGTTPYTTYGYLKDEGKT